MPVGVVFGAKVNITKACTRVIAHTVEWNHPAMWVIKQLFPSDILQACKAGYAACAGSHRIGNGTYPIDNLFVNMEGSERDLFTNHGMLAPHPEHMFRVGDKVPELIHLCQEVRAIMRNYAQVQYVFDWFNEQNMSAAAFRSYCPWVKTLLEDCEHWRLEGDKFRDPVIPGHILPMVREVAGIMAAALLIQGDPPARVRQGLKLVFSAIPTEAHGTQFKVDRCTLDL